MAQEPTNKIRAGRIEQILGTYQDTLQKVSTFCVDDATDLLTDLRHWCTLNDLDFDDALEMSRVHYEAELFEEGLNNG